MKRLMIVSTLALVLVSGIQLTSAGIAQAGERDYRHGSGSFGVLAHFYGDQHAHDRWYKKDRHFDRRHDRRHYGFLKGQRKPKNYGHYQPHWQWRHGHAAWHRNHWHGKSWHRMPHWNRGHRSYVYRY